MKKDYLISISYPPMAKMITQSQAVDAHSLVGNIGGYIGLFLGKFQAKGKKDHFMLLKICQIHENTKDFLEI